MKIQTKTMISLIFFIVLSAFSTASWHKLGTRTVNYGLDHDKIMVTAKDGAFTALKVDVSGNLNMHKMKVNYANGQSERIPIAYNFRRGRDSRLIDLKGNKRLIRSVDFWYDTKNRSRRRASIRLYGRH